MVMDGSSPLQRIPRESAFGGRDCERSTSWILMHLGHAKKSLRS